MVKKTSSTFRFNSQGIEAGQTGYFTIAKPTAIKNSDIIDISFETNQINDSNGLQITIVNRSTDTIYCNYYASKSITVLIDITAIFYYI